MFEALESLDDFSLIVIFIAILVIPSLLWLALIHRVRGNRYSKEMSTDRAINFKTELGEFRLDKVHGNFNYKLKGETKWATVKLESINRIYCQHRSESAGVFEFLLSDWAIWDFHGNYRDQTNIYSIQLEIVGGENVPLAEIKQFEQRELWLGQFFYEIQIKLLRVMNLNYAIDDVAVEWMHMIVGKFSQLGFNLKM